MTTYFPTVPVETAIMKANLEMEPPRPLVLVVDDEPLILETLRVILDGNGFAVMTAEDGLAALEIARVMPPDVLISDVAMPGMNGFDLAIEVTNAVPDCDIVLFSGEPSTCDRAITYHARGYDFVTLIKLVHPTELLACVFELLSLRGWLVPEVIAPRNANPSDVIFFGPISVRVKERAGARALDSSAVAVSCRGTVSPRRTS